MSFDEEWAELKRQAQDTQPPHMELAGLDGDGSGFEKVGLLHVTPAILKARAAKADEVRGNFAKADDSVTNTETNSELKKSLKGFQSADGYAIFLERWKEQMMYLDGVLGGGVAQALRVASTELTAIDDETAQELGKINPGTSKER